MTDGDKPEQPAPRASVDALLRKQDWGRIRVQLMLFAKPRAKSLARANDVVQEAMMRVFDPTWEPWNPEKYPNVVDFLTSIISRLLVNEKQSARVHRELAMDRDAKEGSSAARLYRKAEKVASSERTPEQRAIAAQLVGRRMDRLKPELEKDAAMRDLVGELEDGNDKKSDQARATGRSPAEIKAARQRLGRHVVRINREIPGDDEEK